MPWPADHPLCTDPTLRPFTAAATELAAGYRVLSVLRYLPGRRVATLLEGPGRRAVLKVFASPRARGNHRRLTMLAASTAASIVPTSLGTDDAGHVHLVSYHPGVELDRLPDADFVSGCESAGVQLRRLHDSGALFDRSWGWTEEASQLERQAVPTTLAAVCEVLGDPPPAGGADWVSAHRDCHPGQMIVGPTGDVRWVDLDDCTMAPRALDVGNMVAHLRREHLRGARELELVRTAEAQFLCGYQSVAQVSLDTLDRWTDIATVRLVALAASRHRDWRLHDRLLAFRSKSAAAARVAG